MASVINTNIAATRTHNVYNRNNDYMNAAMTRVATGMKINSAKDGASTWAISEKMRERIRANDQANQNVQNDTALLKTAQGGISNTIDILKTLKERAINAANDSNLASDRDRIAVEVEQLLEQINDNAGKVKFNGRTLLDGAAADPTKSTFAPSSGSSGSVTAPEKANPPTADNTKGSSAVFSLAAPDVSKFNEGDVITFSWKEDGTEVSKEITVGASFAHSDLEFNESKLSVSLVANGSALTGVTDKDRAPFTAVTADTLYAVGTGETQITDLAVSVVDKDGNTNTAAQGIMEFTGIQQAAQTPTADHSVASITGLATSSGAATASTALADLTAPTGGAAIASGDTITVKIGSETGTYTLSSSTATIQSMIDGLSFTNANFGWFASGTDLTDKAGTVVKDSDGNTVKATADGLYAIGKSGEAATVSIEVKDNANAAKTTALSSPSVLYNYKAKSTDGDDSDSGNGGPSAQLTFHIGGEKSMQMTADIASMKVENLFSGYDKSSFAKLFTSKDGAKTAMDKIDEALTTALNAQTKLGAMESRLGYTSDNLTTMNENLEAADSVMRDSDIAKEMTQYMKYAVLSQASQYMLAQAGQNAFQVLNLLQQ